ncbi:uncharacterized protein L969DRAFT_46383 [Mixia osmundae IAM 14324]|uniref:Secreted protein n=1 Tax=Mixia osmundae (strain CBS 9802 / IAM 14324 / JCM 22182 / KY 12970) TaxID=764103 RepID=G7E5D9_MIXOS|nr:uncharacterized protein L969DRAFT_46383 [Mixia osmundae IAM 14324]KEI40800.1 hypothetical protein L969DRAFT_46383 [Mixia osmundae IAM 14324]GAA98049.1 hypothetical protein E5Q_04730 [Mixia osmundae IAM 14324]
MFVILIVLAWFGAATNAQSSKLVGELAITGLLRRADGVGMPNTGPGWYQIMGSKDCNILSQWTACSTTNLMCSNGITRDHTGTSVVCADSTYVTCHQTNAPRCPYNG